VVRELTSDDGNGEENDRQRRGISGENKDDSIVESRALKSCLQRSVGVKKVADPGKTEQAQTKNEEQFFFDTQAHEIIFFDTGPVQENRTKTAPSRFVNQG
jgi:hypothetical protein